MIAVESMGNAGMAYVIVNQDSRGWIALPLEHARTTALIAESVLMVIHASVIPAEKGKIVVS